MKEVWHFLKWHWNKWSWEQRIYMLGAGFFGAGLVEWVETGQPPLATRIAFTIWCSLFIKWFFWDMTKASWQEYKKEKAELFTVIKEGHK